MGTPAEGRPEETGPGQRGHPVEEGGAEGRPQGREAEPRWGGLARGRPEGPAAAQPWRGSGRQPSPGRWVTAEGEQGLCHHGRARAQAGRRAVTREQAR